MLSEQWKGMEEKTNSMNIAKANVRNVIFK